MAPLTALAAVLCLSIPHVSAQLNNSFYTVWSSVVFTRTGERTPAVFNPNPTVLTALGAQQAYAAGSYLRSRYLGQYTGNGVGTAPIFGLNPDSVNIEQVYVGSPDYQYTAATAQAFLQGFYPPSNTSTTLSNGTQVEGPLGGYQYPLIQTYSFNDPESVFLNAQINCPAFDYVIETYEGSQALTDLADSTASIYQAVGEALLQGIVPSNVWSAYEAWPIWDYLNYQNNYDVNVSAVLSSKAFSDPATGTPYLDLLGWYASELINGWYGNLNAINNVTDQDFSAAIGSVSTIAGNFLASQILGQLQAAVQTQGQSYKLNLLFGDFQPLMSLFALTSLNTWDSNFLGIPEFASTAVFELFSYTDGTGDAAFPSDLNDLFVMFYFQNGTTGQYQAYPLFQLGPDSTSLSWPDFENEFYSIIPGTPADWCTECGASSPFCPSSTPSSSTSSQKISPAIAGVIGALVALVFAALLFAAFMLFAGVRLHRTHGRPNDAGGYKGSRKLASDTDLVIPKGGAVVSAEETPGSPPRGGHERVGSWELKQKSEVVDEVHDLAWQRPVVPVERV
ncbi:histidine phosphatase superfamily [Neohortaea acidophila]|uniref:Histidine phosphatase superfamily n=1 Tax=Neohortaea acidophila TaxID=245834 RepID=A0A6A6PTF3_9PEZI|nr:histidine phosphatase superfamily [Neohortaea acidophila]KAF2483165.1 histidine phosphatase superfamily [Neohortaea acidophila]